MARHHDNQPSAEKKRKEANLRVVITYSPAPDSHERLRRLAQILLGPPLGDGHHHDKPIAESADDEEQENQNAAPG